jgi:hypothetical protein
MSHASLDPDLDTVELMQKYRSIDRKLRGIPRETLICCLAVAVVPIIFVVENSRNIGPVGAHFTPFDRSNTPSPISDTHCNAPLPAADAAGISAQFRPAPPDTDA